MKGEPAAPLVAARRKTIGPRGQPPGTVATSPKEVDAIVRQEYDRIYDGNVEEQEAFANRYMRDYDPYIFKMSNADIMKINGGEVEEAARAARETAAGMDQWSPADLKMLSKRAYAKLADLMGT